MWRFVLCSKLYRRENCSTDIALVELDWMFLTIYTQFSQIVARNIIICVQELFNLWPKNMNLMIGYYSVLILWLLKVVIANLLDIINVQRYYINNKNNVYCLYDQSAQQLYFLTESRVFGRAFKSKMEVTIKECCIRTAILYADYCI